MSHSSSCSSLSQCVQRAEVEQAQMVSAAPHFDIISVRGQGGVGRALKGKSDGGSASQREHDAEDKYRWMDGYTPTHTDNSA